MNTNILKKSCRESVPHPLCYITNSVGTATVAVLSALVVQVIMLCVTKSFQSLVIVLCATAASVLSEFLYGLVRENFPIHGLLPAYREFFWDFLFRLSTRRRQFLSQHLQFFLLPNMHSGDSPAHGLIQLHFV